MTDDPFDLARFVSAQDPVYERVLEELRHGRKRTHWMWFVFPQLIGLGASAMADRYAVRSRAEAAAYLRHEILGPRLKECTELINAVKEDSIRRILGFPDDRKFHSSMTLFAEVDGAAGVYRQALARFFDGRPDPRSLEILAALDG